MTDAPIANARARLFFWQHDQLTVLAEIELRFPDQARAAHQEHVIAIALQCRVGMGDAERDQRAAAVSRLFAQLANGGFVGRLTLVDDPAGHLERRPIDTVTILANEDESSILGDRHDRDPIAAIERETLAERAALLVFDLVPQHVEHVEAPYPFGRPAAKSGHAAPVGL